MKLVFQLVEFVEMDCATPMLLLCAGVVGMDALSPKHLIFATKKSLTSERKSLNSVLPGSICSRYPIFRSQIQAKRANFQGIFLPSKNKNIYSIVFMVSVLIKYRNDTIIPMFSWFHIP